MGKKSFLNMTLEEVRGLPLSSLNMSTRLRNCLQSQGLDRVEDLEGWTEGDFAQVRNLGSVTRRELKDLLADLGIGMGLAQTKVHVTARAILTRIRIHPMMRKNDAEDCFRFFCDIMQPRFK